MNSETHTRNYSDLFDFVFIREVDGAGTTVVIVRGDLVMFFHLCVVGGNRKLDDSTRLVSNLHSLSSVWLE